MGWNGGGRPLRRCEGVQPRVQRDKLGARLQCDVHGRDHGDHKHPFVCVVVPVQHRAEADNMGLPALPHHTRASAIEVHIRGHVRGLCAVPCPRLGGGVRRCAYAGFREVINNCMMVLLTYRSQVV